MTSSAMPNGERPEPIELDTQPAEVDNHEEAIYSYFLALVRTGSPEIAIEEFKNLFFQFGENKNNSAVWNSLFRVIYANDEDKFYQILNRCCYILVNNWQSSRNQNAIQALIQAFEDPTISYRTSSLSLQRLRAWLTHFCKSQEYKELELFAARNEEGPWTHRYSTYLLAHQYAFGKSEEQKEAARSLSRQLKDRFKFDLAMYTARSNSPIPFKEINYKNPTTLGDDVLRLIKIVVAKRGPYNHSNLANIFVKQTEGVTYKEFKLALKKYLIFSVNHQKFVETINTRLYEKIHCLYQESDEEKLTDSLLTKTCKKVVEYLTTENGAEPSLLFILLLSNGNPLTLALVLLKIALICPKSYSHLEACLATLIRYYEERSQSECQWLINFLEVVRITFAIYTGNVEYNLVSFNRERAKQLSDIDENSYRIFSFVNRRMAKDAEVMDAFDDADRDGKVEEVRALDVQEP